MKEREKRRIRQVYNRLIDEHEISIIYLQRYLYIYFISSETLCQFSSVIETVRSKEKERGEKRRVQMVRSMIHSIQCMNKQCSQANWKNLIDLCPLPMIQAVSTINLRHLHAKVNKFKVKTTFIMQTKTTARYEW